MKIRNRLALYFTIIYAVVIFIILLYSFLTAKEYSNNEFQARIKERVYVASRVFLKEDTYSPDNYLLFKNRFSQTLSAEILQVYNPDNQLVFTMRADDFFITRALLQRIRNEHEVSYTYDDRQYCGIYYRDNQGAFVIVASAIDLAGRERLLNLFKTMAVGFVISVLLIYFLGQLFAKKALQPMTRIIEEVNQITASKLNVRVEEGRSRDEIYELALTFNKLLERLEESFEVQRTFVNNASHELRTPLTGMIAELEVLRQRDREPSEYKEALTIILNETWQMKNLVNNLLSLVHADAGSIGSLLEDVRIDELLIDIRKNMLLREPGLKIRLEFEEMPEEEEDLCVHGSRQLLATAFSNLLDNAVKFSSGLEVVCTVTCRAGTLTTRIVDHGIGIAARDMKNICQPFFRASNASGFPGHGMGLSLTSKILRMHGGKIVLFSEEDKGTTAEVTF